MVLLLTPTHTSHGQLLASRPCFCHPLCLKCRLSIAAQELPPPVNLSEIPGWKRCPSWLLPTTVGRGWGDAWRPWSGPQAKGQGWGGAHIVSQEGNAMGEALGIWYQAAFGVTPTNPAVIHVKVCVAQVPPSVLCQVVGHLHEEPLAGERQGTGQLSHPPPLSSELFRLFRGSECESRL